MKLSVEERKRHKDGMILLNLLSNETSVVQKPLTPSSAENVPDNTSQDILSVLKGKKHEVYGSLAMSSKTFGEHRAPQDIDMVVQNPRAVAGMISHKMTMRGHKTKVESNQEFNSHVVQVKKKNNWVDVADIHPIAEHNVEFDVFGKSVKPTSVGGVNVQAVRDQLFRKANSVMAYNSKTQTYGAAPKRKQKDVGDFVTTSRLLIDSKQLQAEAEIAKVMKARKALKSWEKHATKVGAKNVKKDPIPETQEQKFIRHAVENPGLDVDMITFRTKGTFNRKPKKSKKSKKSKKNSDFWY